MSKLPTSSATDLTSAQPMTQSKQLSQWIFNTIRPYLKGRTLEIGSGLGTISSIFIENGVNIHLSDGERYHCDLLSEKFNGRPAVRAVHMIDFHHPDFARIYVESLGPFNTVFAVNVVEHSPADQLTTANAKLLLRKGNLLMLIAPVNTVLFYGLDQNEEEWERYNFDSVQKLFGGDFNIIKTRYINLAGVLDKPAPDQLGLSVLAIGQKK